MFPTAAFGVVGFNSASSGWAIGTEGASSSPGGIGLLGVDWNCGQSGCTLVGGTVAELQTATDGTLLSGWSGADGANTNTITQVFNVDGTGKGLFAGGVGGQSNGVVPGNSPGVDGIATATSGVAVGTAGVSASPEGSGIAGLSGSCADKSCTVANGTAELLLCLQQPRRISSARLLRPSGQRLPDWHHPGLRCRWLGQRDRFQSR